MRGTKEGTIMAWSSSARHLVGLTVGAGLLVALSAELATAAPTRLISNTNLRQGPGTTFGVLATIPGGDVAEVTGRAQAWCTAHCRGPSGYTVATNLDPRGPPPPRVSRPP